jgi:hypothetical protein
MELLKFLGKLLWNILATAGQAFWSAARPLLASKSVLLSIPRSVGFVLAGVILSALEMVVSVFRVNRRVRIDPVEAGNGTGSRPSWVPSFRLQHNLQVAMALTVIIGCYGGLIVWTGWRVWSGPKEDVRASIGVGHRAIDEVGKLLPGGGKVLVVTWKTSIRPGNMPQEKAQLNGLKQILGLRPNLQLAGIERIGLEQVDGRTGRMAGVFFDILQRHPEADAVVSFVGVPDIEPAEVEKLGRALPRFVVLTDLSEAALDRFIHRKLVTVAIIPRREPVTGEDLSAQPATAYESFERAYLVIRDGAATTQTGGG